jgi:hypothetical protein
MFNKMFRQQAPIEALLTYIIIPLNKPEKPQTADNTRPISLVNIVRKALSNIALERLQPYLQKMVSINQRAYQIDRCAVDIIWIYRWINATVQKYNRIYEIMGIDLSKAFYCINRTKLLETMRPHIDNSLYNIIQYLLSDTKFSVRVVGKSSKKSKENIGTPQGDALSPVSSYI